MKSFISNLKSKAHAVTFSFSGLKSKGFTLVELLIVIVLLGILSGVLMSVVNPEKVREDARGSVRVSDLRKVSEAVETYAKLEGDYPESQADLISSDYISNWPENITYTYTDSSFTVATPTSSSEYLVYSSYGEQIVSCPSGEITEDCEELSGGSYVAPCIPPGQDCEGVGECCLEAPYCSGGVCRDCFGEGDSCRGSSECCSSAPYCVSDVCASCKPAGYSCSDESECCGSNVCSEGICAAPCVLAGGSCSSYSDCCSSICHPYTKTCFDTATLENLAYHKSFIHVYNFDPDMGRMVDGSRSTYVEYHFPATAPPYVQVIVDLGEEFNICSLYYKFTRYPPVNTNIRFWYWSSGAVFGSQGAWHCLYNAWLGGGNSETIFFYPIFTRYVAFMDYTVNISGDGKFYELEIYPCLSN